MPSMLFKLARRPTTVLPQILGDVSKQSLTKIDVNDLMETHFDMRNLLLQAGYLSVERQFTKNADIMFSLKYPNLEVEKTFVPSILTWLTGLSSTGEHQARFLTEGMEGFLEACAHTIGTLPYETDGADPQAREYWLHTLLHAIAHTSGAFLSADSEIARMQAGRPDLVLQTEDRRTFVLELKVVALARGCTEEEAKRKTAKEMAGALAQVKKYQVARRSSTIERFAVVYSSKLGLSWERAESEEK
jgi:hypothetical protein